jgi:hypothetical protein
MYLNPALSFCEVQNRYVFLDLERDRYFCLAGALEAAWRAVLASEAGTKEIEMLEGRGLIVHEPGAPLAPCPPGHAATNPTDGPSALRSSAWRMLALASTILRARGQLRRAGLGAAASTLERVKRKARPARPGDDRGLSAIARDMMRLCLLTTAHNQCLPHSLALANYLARHGYVPDLVIAVRLGPFRAHCWVECDGMLINDRPERVRHYTPIRRL